MSTNNPAAVGGDQDSTPTSEIDVLNNEDSQTTVEETEVVEEESSEEEETEQTETETEETTEEPESEEEDETPDTESEEETTTEEPTRLSWQLMKEKYPELAKNKDFRELYFRDKAFTEVFPTVADAKEAATKAEQLDVIDQVLVDGDVDTLFTNINTDVLKNISTKILPALYKANKDYFALAARPIVLNMLHSAGEKIKQSGDKNLEISFRNVVRVITGKSELPPVVPDATENPAVMAEINKLKQTRDNILKDQERSFVTSADKTVMKRIESLIIEGLDPKKELNDFSRKAVIRETIADVRRTLITDEGFKTKIKGLQRLAARANFPEEYKTRIIAASLDRAKKLIPVLRNKHRTAALSKQSTKGEIVRPNKIVSSGTEKVTTSPSRITSVKQIDMRKTSEEDFLNDKVTFRK